MYSVIVLAAGESRRMGASDNKVFFRLGEKSVLERALSWFVDDKQCGQIVLVVHADEEERVRKAYKADVIVVGGKSREESVRNALPHIVNPYVMVHDGARPFIGQGTLSRLKNAMASHSAVTPGVKVYDTLKRVENGKIVETIDRKGVVRVQTPQAFHTEVLREAHQIAQERTIKGTCDVSLVEEALSVQSKVVEGDERNLKLTTPEHLSLLEMIVDE